MRRSGLERSEIRLSIDDPGIAALAAKIDSAGGVVLGTYREPFSGRPILLASLPLKSVEPTPAETADNVYELGTDTFLVRDGKIAVQSFASRVVPKR